jgi:DNA-binding response OmpR family regulator
MSQSAPLILVAEDDTNIRMLIRMTLDSGRVDIVEVEDGLAAIRVARERTPDLVFLDWRMPGLSGIQVCEALRAQPETEATKIVMVSGRTHELDRQAALDAGVDEFITKPFSPIALLEKVREVLGTQALL